MTVRVDSDAVGCSPSQLASEPRLRARYPWTPRSRSGITRQIRRGLIPANLVGNRWVIDLRALALVPREHGEVSQTDS